VFALEAGSHRPTPTYRRLAAAAGRLGPDGDLGNLLAEGGEAFLVAQFARISQGLRSGTDGAVIHPSELDAETRTLLITSFRTIMNLLEATAERFQITWRA
jgi:signal-transduction protein with cAMP-binding, CBS, and nucleotidyltransferase domain